MDLVFDKVSYLPDDDVTGIAPESGTLTISHLGTPLSTVPCKGRFNLGAFAEGGYSVSWADGAQTFSSSFEVLSDSWQRLRYGFVAEFNDAVITENYQDRAKNSTLLPFNFMIGLGDTNSLLPKNRTTTTHWAKKLNRDGKVRD
jgi:hypothetical protein